MNITPSSAFWPSSAVPPSTVSHSCRTTPLILTLSSSLRALHSLPHQGKHSCSPRAWPATLTPQEALPSQKTPINTQVSKSCQSLWNTTQHIYGVTIIILITVTDIHVELYSSHGNLLWALGPCPASKMVDMSLLWFLVLIPWKLSETKWI